MTTRKITIELDEKLLTQVQNILSTTTVESTVREALREVVRAEARREEVAALAAMEGMDLDDPEIMAKAWRQ